MDKEEKDNLTEATEELEKASNPEEELEEGAEQTTVDSDGETVTLDQDKIDNK